MSVKGSRTEQNLLKAFAGESQARNRYTFFSSVAKKEGYEQIASIFTETADNEKEHAEVFFKYLEGGPVEITAAYPAGKRGPPPRTSRRPRPVRGRSGPPCIQTLPASPLRKDSKRSPNRSGRYQRSKGIMSAAT